MIHQQTLYDSVALAKDTEVIRGLPLMVTYEKQRKTELTNEMFPQNPPKLARRPSLTGCKILLTELLNAVETKNFLYSFYR